MEELKKYYTGGINGSDENDYTDDPYGDNGWWNT